MGGWIGDWIGSLRDLRTVWTDRRLRRITIALFPVLVVAVIVVAVVGPSRAPSRWSEFVAFDRQPMVAQFTNRLQRAHELTTGTDEQLIAAYAPLATDAATVVAWLDAHPPDACYATLHGVIRQMYDRLADGLTAVITGLRQGDTAAVDRGAALADTAQDLLPQAQAAYAAVRC